MSSYLNLIEETGGDVGRATPENLGIVERSGHPFAARTRTSSSSALQEPPIILALVLPCRIPPQYPPSRVNEGLQQ